MQGKDELGSEAKEQPKDGIAQKKENHGAVTASPEATSGNEPQFPDEGGEHHCGDHDRPVDGKCEPRVAKAVVAKRKDGRRHERRMAEMAE